MLSSGVDAAMASKIRASLGAGVLVLSLATQGRATEPASLPGADPATAEATTDERNVLVLRLEGPLDPEREAPSRPSVSTQRSPWP